MEYRVELRTVNQPDEVRIEDDPVRKGIDYHFRTTDGRKIFTIPDKAVVCTAKTDKLPITMDELQRYSSPDAEEFTIFYTVWSYEKGYGRLILNYVLPLLNTKRYVTLSPKTDMAVRFHTRNGAKMIADNPESYNFEYYK
tara:strand:+ start:327 stop:746 length:420 start_codon:yes stop_codon:yes gene_type:complete